jgi:ABA DEFICIENT 4-like
MYQLLFNLAGFAIVGWVLMIFFPAWSVTRWIARSAVFPIYLAALYLVGVVPLLLAMGLGTIREFGSADGVVRLLSQPAAALVIWIHVLAFDQLTGLFIYRDNMRERVVPMPVQSIILVLTLMFGPAGFLLYYVLRVVRPRASALGG